MMDLANKQILFIAPAFFGYEKKIVEKMEELGAKVVFFDERSITSVYEKALLKISPLIFKTKTMRYYEDIFKKITNETFDYVFVIKCEMLPLEVIRKLRDMNPNATFCLYLYDSLINIRGITSKLNAFDRVLSFDLEDSRKHSNIKFRPLFYIDSYKREFRIDNNYKYDISFIGTIHSDRYAIIKMIKSLAQKKGLSSYFYCYLQSKFIYYYYKVTKSEFRNTSINDFTFDKVDSSLIADIIDETRTVLDIQHPKQTGLTMRTIEMLGMNKKLITTNSNIQEYDFYNPNNILVIDRKNIEIPESFLDTPYQKIDEEIYKNYSLENWIYNVLGLKGA